MQENSPSLVDARSLYSSTNGRSSFEDRDLLDRGVSLDEGGAPATDEGVLSNCLNESRHYVDLVSGKPYNEEEEKVEVAVGEEDGPNNWRMKERVRTVDGA